MKFLSQIVQFVGCQIAWSYGRLLRNVFEENPQNENSQSVFTNLGFLKNASKILPLYSSIYLVSNMNLSVLIAQLNE